MTIRRKLIVLYSGLLGIVILLFGVGVFTVIRATWIETVDSALRETADQVMTNSKYWAVPEFGPPERVLIDLPELDVFRASGVMVQVWSIQADGNPKWEAASQGIAHYYEPLDPDALNAKEAYYHNTHKKGIELRVLTAPIVIEGRIFGRIQVAASLQTVNQATSRLIVFMGIGGGTALLASVAFGWWLSNQTLKPIEAITKAADNITTAQDLSTRLTWNGPLDELGRLTVVFNRMLDRLEHLFKAQQRLVQDVSHELRTPLTAIRGHFDLIKRYGVDSASMEAIQSEAERMSRLVNDLLLLARADYGNLTLDMMEVDLDTVITEVYKEARVLAQERQLQIKMSVIEPIRTTGNSDRLKQLLLNLVSNAIKFTPDGGAITLSLRRIHGMAELQVSDTGIGIQPQDVEHIFDRFYQADSSRARLHVGEGTGLGLAIAKWIAEAHKGTIGVQSTPNVQTTFTVRLPITQPSINLEDSTTEFPALRPSPETPIGNSTAKSL
jgi:signal transduction histidine kinase